MIATWISRASRKRSESATHINVPHLLDGPPAAITGRFLLYLLYSAYDGAILFVPRLHQRKGLVANGWVADRKPGM